MSDAALSALQRRVDELVSENATLKSEAKTRRHKSNKLQDEVDRLTKELGTVTAERDGLKTKVDAKPGELQAEIDRLQGELLSRDHRDAFAGVREFTVKDKDGKDAKYTLNDGVAVEDLWTTLKYKAEGDKPDAAKITGLLQQAAASKPYLFKPAGEAPKSDPGGSQQPSTTARREPGPGSGTRVTTPVTGERPSTASIVQADFAKSGRTIPGKL